MPCIIIITSPTVSHRPYHKGLTLTASHGFTNANDVFKAEIKIGANGIPEVQPSPKCEGRTYTVEGKEVLGDEWHPRRDGDQFFRIKVKLE